jgi:hypothetical protein
LLSWYNGVLAFKRSHLDSVLWLQLYKPQLTQMWSERQMSSVVDTASMVNMLVQKAEYDALGKPQLPFRITTEFKNIKTTGFLELSQALLGWQAAGIINKEIALKEGGLAQYIDDMAEEAQKKVALGNDMLVQEQAMMSSTAPTAATPVITGQAAPPAMPPGAKAPV